MQDTEKLLRPVWAEINLDNLKHNVRVLKSLLNNKILFTAVIKADAYGHGIFPLCTKLEEAGADCFAVATLEEAVELRKKTDLPILLFDGPFAENCHEIINHNITPSIFSYEQAEMLNNIAVKIRKEVKVHLKIDTGMGRLGLKCNDNSVSIISKIASLSKVKIEGIYTHFASADDNCKIFTSTQISRFISMINRIKRKGIVIPIKHASNSAAIIDIKENSFNMVRAGISMYGCYPSENQSRKNINLKPVLSLHGKIVHIHEIEAGEGVSYGLTFKAKRKTRIATVPIGYADGYPRQMSNTGHAIVKDKDIKVKIAGRICMDKIMLDITEVDAAIGDEIILIGKAKNSKITVEEIAKKTNTVNYEILTSLGRRVSRIYKQNNQAQLITNYLL